MASTEFEDKNEATDTDGTPIVAAWLNEVNDLTHDVFGAPTNKDQARSAIGVVEEVSTLGSLTAIDVSGFSGGEDRDAKGRNTAGDDGAARFIFRSGDQSSNVTASPERYFPPDSDATGASGAWELVRFYRQQIESLSDLQSASGQFKDQKISLLGRTTTGDGGEGTFIWRTGDKSTEVGNDEVTSSGGDGGIWVAPTSDLTGASGAWERLDIKELTPQMYGAFGDGTIQTASMTRVFTVSADKLLPLYLGDESNTYKTDAKIEITMGSGLFKYWRVYGDGATLLNTATDLLVVKGGAKFYTLFEGFKIIGSDDDFSTRNPGSGLVVDTSFGIEYKKLYIAGWSVNGLRIARGLFNRVEKCRTRYNGTHLFMDDDDLAGNSVSSNVSEVVDCVLDIAREANDPKANSTDIGIDYRTSVNTRVVHNTFEFVQQWGVRLNKNRAAVIESNFFEHGEGGIDIKIDGSINNYTQIGANNHNAGSGDGGTSGGHKPFEGSGGRFIILPSIGVDGYHADNVDSRYADDTMTHDTTTQTVGEINIVPRREDQDRSAEDYRLRLSEASQDTSKSSVFSRNREVAGSTTDPFFSIETVGTAHFTLEISLHHGRNTDAQNGGFSVSYVTFHVTSGVVTEVQTLTQNTKLGTPFSWSFTTGTNLITFSLANTTSNTHRCHYDAKVYQASTLAGILVKFNEL